MVVKNNREATNTLNTLNKNSKALARSLAKVSTGMKINSAQDDASGYAISERMRVQIRGLEQAGQNAQTGLSVLKTAEGAVQSSVEILKTLKEKAINAANDTNTDADRAIIQKEIDQAVDQLDDNANVTYNGKYLIDGSMNYPPGDVKEIIIRALNTEWLENSLNLIEQSFGMNFEENGTSVKEMSVHFDEGVGGDMADALAWVAFSQTNGIADTLELHINMDKYRYLIKSESNVDGKTSLSTADLLDRTIAHEMTHAVMAANITDMNTENMPLYTLEGAAELVHGIDDTRKAGLQSFDGTIERNSSGTTPYTEGYIYYRYLARQSGGTPQEILKRYMRVLDEQGGTALDAAVAAASKGKYNTNDELLSAIQSDFSAAGSATAFLKDYCGIDLDNLDTGSLLGYDASKTVVKTAKSVIPEGGSTRFWYYPDSDRTSINGLEVVWPGYSKGVMPFSLQVGTKANQNIKIAFGDLTAEGLGLKAADGGGKVSVATRYKANEAIALLDQSLRKALSQQTMIGAIESRLEYTASNITTSLENTQNSESTIRDADMAKEMTDYTKNNVLLQAAQSMLAQANQNSSSVLSLLQ